MTGEKTQVPGKQELAVKIFNRKNLKSQITSEFDPETKCMKLSNHLNTIYSEISVWERVAHNNIVKIFELFDDNSIESMYLMMELAAFGQIQDDHDINGNEDLVTTNKAIFDIAVEKNGKIWPKKKDQNSKESAARWIFY